MSAPQSEDGKQGTGRGRKPKTPKLTLMKSYAAVNDDDLQNIVGKIRRITQTANARGTSPTVAEPALEPAPEPAPDPIDQTIDQSLDQAIDHSVDQAVDQPSGQSTRQSTIPSTKWPNGRSIERSNETPHGTSNVTSIRSSNEIDAPDATPRTIVFSDNQAILYQCIYWLQGQTTSLQRIGQATGISAFTLKHCLYKLRKVGAIEYHGRQNSGGRMGFSATALPCVMVLRGDEHLLRQRIEDIKLDRLPIARPIDPDRTRIGDSNGPFNSLMGGRMDDRMDSPTDPAPSSSSKEQLLQDLILGDAFQNLNPQSLVPYLAAFNTGDELQDFIDMADACVSASRRTDTPIRNPKGFLIAQLKAGYINPPDGYKSRRVRAQEQRNRQLEAELEEIKRLKAEEERLELNVFRARLSAAEQQRLAREARDRVSPRSPLSESRQIEMAEHEILRDWLQASKTQGNGPASHSESGP